MNSWPSLGAHSNQAVILFLPDYAFDRQNISSALLLGAFAGENSELRGKE